MSQVLPYTFSEAKKECESIPNSFREMMNELLLSNFGGDSGIIYTKHIYASYETLVSKGLCPKRREQIIEAWIKTIVRQYEIRGWKVEKGISGNDTLLKFSENRK